MSVLNRGCFFDLARFFFVFFWDGWRVCFDVVLIFRFCYLVGWFAFGGLLVMWFVELVFVLPFFFKGFVMSGKLEAKRKVWR